MPFLDKLCHHIDIVSATSLNDYGEEQAALTSAGRPCLITGTKRRILTGQGSEVLADYMVAFLYDEEVSIGDLVQNAVDANGNPLFEKGRVVGVQDVIHPFEGKIGKTAYVQRN